MLDELAVGRVILSKNLWPAGLAGSFRVRVTAAVPVRESGGLTPFCLVSEARVGWFAACGAVGAAARGATARSRCMVKHLRATLVDAVAVVGGPEGGLCFAADEAVVAVRWEGGFLIGLVRAGFLVAPDLTEVQEIRGLELRERDAAVGAVRNVRWVVVSEGLLADSVDSAEEIP